MRRDELSITCIQCQRQEKPCCPEHQAIVAAIRLECLADRVRRASGTKWKALEGLGRAINV
jgi:hypothetical protein